jgi:PCI domain
MSSDDWSDWSDSANDDNDHDDDDNFDYVSDFSDDDDGDDSDDTLQARLSNIYYESKALAEERRYSEALDGFESVCKSLPKCAQNWREKHSIWHFKALKQMVLVHLLCANYAQVLSCFESRLLKECSRLVRFSELRVERGLQSLVQRVSVDVEDEHARNRFYEMTLEHVTNPAPFVEHFSEANSGGANGSASSSLTLSSSGAIAMSSSSPSSLSRSLSRSSSAATMPLSMSPGAMSPLLTSSSSALRIDSQSIVNQRIWFFTKLKQARSLLANPQRHGQVMRLVKELRRACQRPDGSDDVKKPQLLEVYALEIQLYTALQDTKRLEKLYARSMAVKVGVVHPFTRAIIHMCGGKLHMIKRDWKRARDAFNKAFRGFDETGDANRLTCLKYVALASIFMSNRRQEDDDDAQEDDDNEAQQVAAASQRRRRHVGAASREQQLAELAAASMPNVQGGHNHNRSHGDAPSSAAYIDVDPLEATEAQPYRTHPEVEPMLQLLAAFRQNEIRHFEAILRRNETLLADDLISMYLSELLGTARAQILLKLLKPYSRIKLPFIAHQLNIGERDVESLLVKLILDKQLHGSIDQANRTLILERSTQTLADEHYAAIHQWASNVQSLYNIVI